jgi:predicted RNA binding protein YcfA (HicA-like mRNA interferase family)
VSKKVTFKQLKETLTELGFEADQPERKHVIFRHADTGAVLTLPTTSTVPPVYVANTEAQVIKSGITTSSTFEKILRKRESG